ncbi:hypothetical protein ACFCZR_29390 [Streptomyces rubiginosohelvolus]|uniref:hypothetical protein n=1 Tax=Streptomyces rubiginosohelvolus TaxID=67362 RepID=UPI0035E325EE
MFNVIHSLTTDEEAWKVLGFALSVFLDLLRQFLDQRKARREPPAVDVAASTAVSPSAPIHPSRRVGELRRAIARRRNAPAAGDSTDAVQVIAEAGRAAPASGRTPNHRPQ